MRIASKNCERILLGLRGPHFKENAWVAVITFIGLLLRLPGLNRDFWLDEVYSFLAARNIPLLTLLKRELFGEGLVEILMKPLTHLGMPNWVLRLPSLLFSVALIPVSYAVAHRLFGKRAACLAAVLVALSSFQVRYAQEARNYAAFALFSTLAMLLALSAWRRPRWYLWLGLGIAEALAFYAHYFALFAILGIGLLGIAKTLAILWKRREGRIREGLGFAASQFVLALLTLPTWPSLQQFLANQNLRVSLGSGTSDTALNAQFLLGLVQEFGFGSGWGAYTLLALFARGLAILVVRRNWTALALSALLFLPPLVILGSVSARHFTASRHFIFLQPVYLMIAAMAVVSLAEITAALARRLGARSVSVAALAGCAAALAFIVGAALPLRTLYLTEKEGWRSAAAFLNEAVTQEDRILVPDSLVEQYLSLLQPRLSSMITIAGEASALEAACASAEDVWLVFPDWNFLRRRPGSQDLLYWGVWDGRAINLDFSHVYVKRAQKNASGTQIKEDTARLLESLIASGQDDLATRVALAKLYVSLGKPDQAATVYRAVLARSPNAWVWTLLADAQIASGNPRDALQSCMAALDLNPGYANRAWFRTKLGGAYQMMGDDSRARAEFERANALSPAGGVLQLTVSPKDGITQNMLLTAEGGPFASGVVVEICRTASAAQECSQLTDVDRVNVSQIRFRMPADSEDSRYLVRALNPDGRKSGAFVIEVGERHAPSCVSISPSDLLTEVGTTIVVDAAYQDPDGWEDIVVAYLLIAPTPNPGPGTVMVGYNNGSNLLFLRDDNNTTWLGGLTPGRSGTAENASARLLASSSRVARSGDTLVVRFAIQFKRGFAGSQHIYLLAADRHGLKSQWSALGTCRVEN
jgi:tetratricopeptide (TPR) repeat protein